MYEFLHHNPKVVTKPLSYTNNPYIVAQQDNFISVNSCISVDLTGQVCSESIGGKQFSGTGGQVDFVRGAQMSKGGMSFIAMRSTNTKKDGTTTSKNCVSASGRRNYYDSENRCAIYCDRIRRGGFVARNRCQQSQKTDRHCASGLQR